MKLNKLQRIGVVVSVIWALGVAYVDHNYQIEKMDEHEAFFRRMCVDEVGCAEKLIKGTLNVDAANTEKTYNKIMEACDAEMDACLGNYLKDARTEPDWRRIAFLSLAPIPLSWGLIYLFIRIFRWIKAADS